MNAFLTVNRVLVGVSLIAAIAYLFKIFPIGSVALIAIKGSCCILLAIVAFRSISVNKRQRLLVLALLFSSVGDIFLALHPSDYFVQGLGSFLIAHLVYIAIFAHARDWSSQESLKTVILGIIIMFSTIMIWFLWPVLGALKAPVILYIAVITLMAFSALYARFVPLFAIGGALSFVASDGMIAINKFLVPFDASGPLIWITYMTAQYALTYAIIKGPETVRCQPSNL